MSHEAWGLASGAPAIQGTESVVGVQRGGAGTAGRHRSGGRAKVDCSKVAKAEVSCNRDGAATVEVGGGLASNGDNMTGASSCSAVVGMETSPGPILGDKRKLSCHRKIKRVETRAARREPNAPAGLSPPGRIAVSRTRACGRRDLGSGGRGDRGGGGGVTSAGSCKKRRVANMASALFLQEHRRQKMRRLD